MIKNYFFLNRFILETGGLLVGKTVFNIYSQEKDKLIIEFGEKDLLQYLEISTNPGEPYINIRDQYSRAKKNTIEIFPSLINNKITTVEISEKDRIIKIGLVNSSIYFTIRGKYTNVINLSDDGTVESFKKTEKEKLNSICSELLSQNYIDKFNNIKFDLPGTEDFWNFIKKKYPILGSEVVKEAKSRCVSEATKSNYLKSVLDDIQSKPIAVYIDENSGEVHLAADTFSIFEYTDKKVFDTLIEAQSFYLSKKYYLKEKVRRKKIIQNHLDKELKKISNKINNLKSRISKGNREEEYKNKGNLLLVNRDKIKPGSSEIKLNDDYGTGEEITIKLDKKLSAQKNIDAYFNKARAEKINFTKSQELMNKAVNDYDKLRKIETDLGKIEYLKDYISIMKQLKIKDKEESSGKEDLKIKFKHYIIQDKYNVYVGKDSKNNDLLTTRFAKQNDFWFHARGASGSHVVLRVESTKEVVPKNVLKKAAALAAYHSKAKTASLVPVAYTFKKYVIKKKGFPVGTVHLLKEDVLLVKPEIPKRCVFVTDE